MHPGVPEKRRSNLAMDIEIEKYALYNNEILSNPTKYERVGVMITS